MNIREESLLSEEDKDFLAGMVAKELSNEDLDLDWYDPESDNPFKLKD